MFQQLSPCCYCIASDKQMSLEDNVAQLKQLMDGAGATDKCPMGRFTREKAEHVLKYIMTRYYTYIYSQYTMPVVKYVYNTQPFTLYTYLTATYFTVFSYATPIPQQFPLCFDASYTMANDFSPASYYVLLLYYLFLHAMH